MQRKTAFKGASAAAARADLAWQERGIALGLFAEDRDFDYLPLLREISAVGASHVSIVVPYYQHSVRSIYVGPHPRFTPDDAVVERTVVQAQKLGLKVLLFPILRLAYSLTVDEWRGAVKPRSPVRWWHSYERVIVKLAALAQSKGVAALSIGSEMESLDEKPGPWKQLIARVRAIYDGALVYSANWHNFERVAIWDLVDVAGISAYFWLVGTYEGKPSFERIVHGWRECRARISRWWVRVRKPLIFTEIGYRSAEGTAATPWTETSDAPLSLTAQVRAYRAFARVWRGVPYLQGIYLWNWFGWGGPRSREFTPRGKPAAQVVCDWFGVLKERCPRVYGVPR